jgi:hypothetical protein
VLPHRLWPPSAPPFPSCPSSFSCGRFVG